MVEIGRYGRQDNKKDPLYIGGRARYREYNKPAQDVVIRANNNKIDKPGQQPPVKRSDLELEVYIERGIDGNDTQDK
jgi:hypothetical protein